MRFQKSECRAWIGDNCLQNLAIDRLNVDPGLADIAGMAIQLDSFGEFLKHIIDVRKLNPSLPCQKIGFRRLRIRVRIDGVGFHGGGRPRDIHGPQGFPVKTFQIPGANRDWVFRVKR